MTDMRAALHSLRDGGDTVVEVVRPASEEGRCVVSTLLTADGLHAGHPSSRRGLSLAGLDATLYVDKV